jgi:4-carboxymuconolactone decarboxylase
LTVDQLDQKQRKLWDTIHAGPPRPLSPSDAGGVLVGPYDPLLRSPEVGLLVSKLGTGIRAATELPIKTIELAISTVAAHWKCELVWAAHQPEALRLGIAQSDLASIAAGSSPVFDDDDESRVVCALVHELVRTGTLSDSSFNAGLSAFGERMLVDLIVSIGHYCNMCFISNAFRIPVQNDFPQTWSG